MKLYEFRLHPTAIQGFVSVVADMMGFTPRKDVVHECYSFGSAFIINRFGDIEFADTLADASIERLIDRLAEQGYRGIRHINPEPTTELQNENRRQVDEHMHTISIERTLFTDEAINNLSKLLEAKCALIKKALGIESTGFEIDSAFVRFRWLNDKSSVEERFYTEQFVRKLCEFCISCKRINAKPRDVENEKYAMRTFCNRIGMAGQEYKGARKMLMANLDGDAAWKNGRP